MPTKPLMPNVQDLLEQSSCGADMLIHWLAAARDDLAQRNDELDALVPAALQDKLVKERQRVSARVCNFAPNTVRPRTRAVWFGLMQKATRTGYNIATYAAISQDTSLTDPEWEASAKMQGKIYVEMPNLTKAHNTATRHSEATLQAIHIILPLAVLGSVVLDLSTRPKMGMIEEYSFGWDDGDHIRWRQ